MSNKNNLMPKALAKLCLYKLTRNPVFVRAKRRQMLCCYESTEFDHP